MTHDDGRRVGRQRIGGIDDAIDQRAARDSMQHLRQLGLHASAFAGSQNDDVKVGHVLEIGRSKPEWSYESSVVKPAAPRRASRSGSTRASERFSGLAAIACVR